MSALPALQIGPVGIRQDDWKRFNANDLHEAGGAFPRHEPRHFLKLDQTRRLVETLQAEAANSGNPLFAPVQVKRGRGGGTYLARELVYAYAMWISPAFYLSVIRVFDQVQRTRKGLGDSRHKLDLQAAVGRKLACRGASDMGHWSWQSRRLKEQYARLDNVLQLSLFNDEESTAT